METQAWVLMLLVCSFVWGGFLAFLIRALRCEARKTARESDDGGR
jgi:hypothetical protein